MTLINNIDKWLVTAFHSVINWITNAEKKLSPALSIAENLVNRFKAFEASTAGQSLEALIESVVPASTGLIDAIKLQFPKWFTAMRLIDGEITKPLDEQGQDAINALQKVKALDIDTYAGDLNTLKALITKFVATNSGDMGTITMPQSLMLAQPSHDPSLTEAA